MAMTKPIALSVSAFDATKPYTFEFTSSGGNQVVSNQITIRNNENNAIVYQNIVTSYKFEQIVPANTLQNNKYYNYYFVTYDKDNNPSEPSAPVSFYCYSTPTITFDNIPPNNIIDTSNYTFNVTYNQAEGELLDVLIFKLYDIADVEIASSGNLYNTSIPPLQFSYEFKGLIEGKIYKVGVNAITVNGTVVQNKTNELNVQYYTPSMYSVLTLRNNCSEGYVEIENNMIILKGESYPDPPIFIDNKKIDLRNKGYYTRWVQGFSIDNNFVTKLWFESPNLGDLLYMSDSSKNNLITATLIQDYIYGTNDLKYFIKLDVTSYGITYTVLSNGIDSITNNKIFLWIKKINNLYDVRIEVLP